MYIKYLTDVSNHLSFQQTTEMTVNQTGRKKIYSNRWSPNNPVKLKCICVRISIHKKKDAQIVPICHTKYNTREFLHLLPLLSVFFPFYYYFIFQHTAESHSLGAYFVSNRLRQENLASSALSRQ